MLRYQLYVRFAIVFLLITNYNNNNLSHFPILIEFTVLCNFFEYFPVYKALLICFLVVSGISRLQIFPYIFSERIGYSSVFGYSRIGYSLVCKACFVYCSTRHNLFVRLLDYACKVLILAKYA